MIPFRQRLLWAGLLAGATFAASAQTPVAPPVAPQANAPTAQQPMRSADRQGPAAERHRDPAQRMERMREHQAKRLADLKQKLQINATQEGAWQGFVTAQQPPARPGQAPVPRMKREEFAKLTTPQRLDKIQQMQAQRTERFAARAAATRSLYATLTPDQQKLFDTQEMHGHRGGRDGHDGHGRHGGPGHDHGPRARG